MPTPVALDLDTFLTTVYVVVDDLYQSTCAPHQPRRPGRRPELSDSEVLTLGLLAQWRADRSEHAFLRWAQTSLRPYFPRLLHASAFNRRLRDLANVLAQLGPLISAAAARWGRLPASLYEVVDGAPVPLMQRCRGDRHRVFTDEAGIGKGGPQKDWYYGVEQMLIVNAQGFITGFVAGPANTDERLLLEGLLRFRADPAAPLPTAAELTALLGPTHRAGGGHRQGPSGPIGPRPSAGQPTELPLLGDLGFRGTAWQRHWQAAFATVLLTQQTCAEQAGGLAATASVHAFRSARQVVERTIGRLEEVFHLQYPRARSLGGLWARLSAKVAAHNLLLYINHLTGRPLEARCSPLN